MKNFNLIIFLLTSLCISPSYGCENGSFQELGTTWKTFRLASLEGDAKKISRFYRFPLKVVSPVNDAMYFKVNKSIFIKNYKSLFIETIPNEENEIFTELKKTTDDTYKEAYQEILQDGCSRSGYAQISSYEFRWSKDWGWRVNSISPPGYSTIEDEFNSYGSNK